MIEILIAYFKEDNPRFDEERFIKAAGYQIALCKECGARIPFTSDTSTRLCEVDCWIPRELERLVE